MEQNTTRTPELFPYANITMEEAVKISPLDRAEIIAGEAGLDRIINFITVMEVPNFINLVQPGEMLLTTGYPFREQPHLLKDLIPLLSKKGLAGLGIKPIYIDPIPDELIEVANANKFPLLKLPLDLVLTDIIRPLMLTINNRKSGILEYSARVYKTLTELVLKGQGTNEVASSLTELIENPIAFVDEYGDLQIFDPYSMETSQFTALLNERFEKTNDIWKFKDPIRIPNSQNLSIEEVTKWNSISLPNGEDIRELQRYIRISEDKYCSVLVWEVNKKISDMDIEAVSRAGTVMVLILLRERAVNNVEIRYQDEFISELLSGRLDDREIVLQRARVYNWNVDISHMVVVLDLDNFQRSIITDRLVDEKKARDKLEHFRRSTFSVVNYIEKGIKIYPIGDMIVLILPRNENTPIKNALQLIDKITSSISENVKDNSISAGIGYLYKDILDLKKSYKEALEALKVGRIVWGRGKTTFIDNIGIYKLLSEIPSGKIHEFIDEYVGRLIKFDEAHNTIYLNTLKAYFANNKNLPLTARELNIHYNTLNYRLQKIEDIIGDFRNDADLSLNIELSLRALVMVFEDL